jgi:hypothetical protein
VGLAVDADVGHGIHPLTAGGLSALKEGSSKPLRKFFLT